MTIKISVVIPTYKRPKLLVKCLNALAWQTLSLNEFEVIVVSDGEDQFTKNLVIEWQKSRPLNLRYLHNITKKGPAAARNLGWLDAKASLIAFTDDDCLPSSDWLISYLAAYSGQSDVAFTGKTKVPMPDKKTDFALNLAQLETAEFITANCACTKKSLIKVGGFDERFKMAWREDSDLEFKFLTNKVKIVAVPSAVVVHPVREVPWGISLSEQKKGIYDALLFKKFPLLYRQKIQPSPLWSYYSITLLSLICISSSLADATMPFYFSIFVLTLLFAHLVLKRLRNRHKSISHILEMLSTSLIIPFLSVFWRFYGAIKYRVLFI